MRSHHTVVKRSPQFLGRYQELKMRRVNFYSLCCVCVLCVILFITGSRYTNKSKRRWHDSHRNVFRSSDPDQIIEKTRVRINFEMAGYNFSQSRARGLQDLVIETGGKPVRSVVVSTWRSGTTFLGEVLNAMPGNFYHYEPLLRFGEITIRGPPHADSAISLIKGMLRCNYSGTEMDKYFEFGKNFMHQFNQNSRLWNHCSFKKELCLNADFTTRFCRLFPFESMKIVRLRLNLVRELLEDNEDCWRMPMTSDNAEEEKCNRANSLNVRIVVMVRDPRAVMQSRQDRAWCKPSPDCWYPELLCADMISNYVAAGQLLQRYPDRVMVLRFEELALDPRAITLQIFKFLGISVMPTVYEFLHWHTTNASLKQQAVPNNHYTFKVSRDVPFKWKYITSFECVDEIQLACKQAMDLWGYRMAQNATHMMSKEFHPMGEYSITPLPR